MAFHKGIYFQERNKHLTWFHSHIFHQIHYDNFHKDMRYSDEPITAFVSENIADIYQEVKDLACNYQTRDEAVMNDALVNCLEAFEQHWGQKLLNVLRPLHAVACEGEQE